jgi:uncharacterized membrane protein
MSRPVDAAAGHVIGRGRVRPVGVLVATTVVLQIGYPLASDDVRSRLTVATVVAFAAASISHAGRYYGKRGLACCGAAAAIGLLAEVIGTHTGVPFGHYRYGDSLGVHVAGVPVLVAFAWTMMAWPAALVARRLSGATASRILIGTWALASWDLFLDPQMVAARHWRWTTPSPHLPGVDTVPLTNLVGWLAVSGLISLVLQGILRGTTPREDRWMLGLYLWTYASSVLALLAFLHLRAAALWGAIGMGAVAVPLALRLRRR